MWRKWVLKSFDIIVVGSGFAGSLIAMIARRLGYSVALVERGKHPRVVVGESSTPLSNLLLETLAHRYDLPELLPLTKWGTWQAAYPQVACGLKRGFTFLHHDLDKAPGMPPGASHHLLVAASPNDAIADTHWFRADLDEWLVRHAQTIDVEYLEEFVVEQASRDAAGWVLEGIRQGVSKTLRGRFLIDATGPRGFLHRALNLAESPLPYFPNTSALYSHFSGVGEIPLRHDIVVANPPYPPDAAAVHHVFDGGWIWVLRFNNGWTSAGAALTEDLARTLRPEEKEPAWRRLLALLPEVSQQFADAVPMRPFAHVPRLAFRSDKIADRDWAMLPSAAGFVDPLLSTGFPLTLFGVLRLSEILERDWNSPRLQQSLSQYAAATDGELLATADLISALYANMNDFPTFRALSLLYFAAASYAETVRRLGKAHLATSFLLHEDVDFGRECRRITSLARQPQSATRRLHLQEEVYRLIEPFDVAGLGKRSFDHCYPVLAADLFENRHKVGATRAEIQELVRKTGFPVQPTSARYSSANG